MALQRQVSPIPPGRYWILVEQPDIRDFDDWLRDMHGAAQVEASDLDVQTLNNVSAFIIFRVPEGRMPFLNALQFGYPSFAPSNINSRGDVIQNELHKNAEDVVVDVIDKAEQGFGGLFVIALLLLAMGGAGALAHR